MEIKQNYDRYKINKKYMNTVSKQNQKEAEIEKWNPDLKLK